MLGLHVRCFEKKARDLLKPCAGPLHLEMSIHLIYSFDVLCTAVKSESVSVTVVHACLAHMNIDE